MKAARLHTSAQRGHRQVDQVSGQVKVKPERAETPRLPARQVRNGNRQYAAGREQTDRLVERGWRITEMLERMPEDDGRPFPHALAEHINLAGDDSGAR